VSCDELIERTEYAAAARVCAKAFEHSGDHRDGLHAAQALSKLQREDDALAILARVVPGPHGTEAQRTIAMIEIGRKQYGAAARRLRVALQLDQARGDHAGASADLGALVAVAWNQDDFATALRLSNAAIAEAEAAGDSTLRASALISQGTVLESAGDYERALEAYAKGSALLAAGDRRERARVLICRAGLLGEQRQYALARPLLEEARSLARAVSDFTLLRDAEVNVAAVALAEHDLDTAAGALLRAQVAWLASRARTPSPGILMNQAIHARYRGDLAGAARSLDAIAATDPTPDYAWTIAHERGLIAYAAHELDAAEQHYLAAIRIIENMWRSSSPEDLKAPFFEDRWLPYQSLFALRLERGDAEGAFATLVSAQGRMFLAEASTASAGASIDRRDRLRLLGPLIEASPIARTFSATDTLEALGERYVLNYFAAAGRMRLLIIDRGALRPTNIDIELSALEKLVDDLLANADDRAAAKALGDALLPDSVVRSDPARLDVIPEGALQRISFAALIAGDERVLQRHDVVYSPSATGLASLGSMTAEPSSAPVVLGDPQGNLRHGADEIRTVVARTGAALRTGREATTSALRAAQQARLLHVIGHSGLDGDGGYLVLADGHVSAAQIVSWQIRPHVVVLPTCASAATRRRDMWGSLAVAFLAAGSVDVVSTLHSVEDASAAEFTKHFYTHGGAADPVAATAAAQRELAKHSPVSTWSSFIVVGL
jgi:tetratricopeptide (TPR) repeat protein